MMRAWVVLGSALLCVACRSTGNSWTDGDYHVVHGSDELEIRTSLAVIEPDGEHVLLHWVGAATPPGEPEIEEFRVIVYDDRDLDGNPGPGEVIESKISRERTRKIMVSGIRIPLGDRPHALRGQARARTRERVESGDWRLLDP